MVKRVLAYPDPGYSQSLQSDDHLCDVIDWDQLSCSGDDDSDVASPSLPFPFIDWEANEEERLADGTSIKSQGNKKTRKRPYVSEDSDNEDAP